MYSLYRRHERDCRFQAKGVRHIKCQCPVWMDGYDLHGKRQRRSMKTRSWSHAQRRIDALEGGAVSDHRESVSLTEAVKAYLADCRVRKLTTSTIRRYQTALDAMAALLGSREVSQISVEMLDGFRAHRSVKAAASSAKELQSLRTFFRFCVERQWAAFNPASRLKPPRLDTLPTLPFVPSEIDAILEACGRIDNPNQREIPRARLRARALVLTLLYSGLRISDAVKLERSSLNLKTGQLLIRMMKTRHPLYVRLPAVALAALEALPKESKYFFWSGNSKLSTAVGSCRRTIDMLMNLAGVADGHPHRFRDTFSVELLQNGAELRTVQLLLGHTSIKTTEKHYAPFVTSMQRVLDAAVSTLHFGSDAQGPVNSQDHAFRNAKKNVLLLARAKRA